MCARAQLFRNCFEQQPSSQVDLESSVIVGAGRECYTGLDLVTFFYHSKCLFWLKS
jgi:hypothetical protein